jgi:TolA-binding protein
MLTQCTQCSIHEKKIEFQKHSKRWLGLFALLITSLSTAAFAQGSVFIAQAQMRTSEAQKTAEINATTAASAQNTVVSLERKLDSIEKRYEELNLEINKLREIQKAHQELIVASYNVLARSNATSSNTNSALESLKSKGIVFDEGLLQSDKLIISRDGELPQPLSPKPIGIFAPGLNKPDPRTTR